jgi:hypothetical protein
MPSSAPTVIMSRTTKHDPVEIRRRIERLVTRVDRRDGYGRLLTRGDVVRRIEDIDDIEAWRSEIKRQARADKIKVRTGANDTITCAILSRAEPPGRQAHLQRYFDMLTQVVPLAVEHRHEPSIAVRDGDELICACDRCRALGYGDVAEDISGGALFEDDCRHEEPGKLTALAMAFAETPGKR